MSKKKLSTRIVASAGALALAGGFAAGYSVPGLGMGSSTSPTPERTVASTTRYQVPVSATQPSHGPGDALVTVVEWCDLRGQACRDVDAPMKALLKEYGDRLRWVHRQLPDPSRKDSHLIHFFARGAFLQGGKFWEVRERLLRLPEDVTVTKDDLRAMADELGLDWTALEKGIEERAFTRYVGVDVLFAGKFGVDSGPAFFVNGRKLQPVPTSELKSALGKLIDEELAEATTHVQNGVAKADLYRELTKDALWSVKDDPIARKAAGAKQGDRATKDM